MEKEKKNEDFASSSFSYPCFLLPFFILFLSLHCLIVTTAVITIVYIIRRFSGEAVEL